MVRQRGTHIFTTSGDENSRDGRVHQVLPLWTDVVNGALSLTTTHRLKRNQKKSLCASLMCFLLAYITSLLTLVTLAIKRAENRQSQAQWRTCSHALLLVISHQCAEEREGDTSLWWSAISIVWGWNTFKGAQRKAKPIKAWTARRRKRRREENMGNRKYCEHKFNTVQNFSERCNRSTTWLNPRSCHLQLLCATLLIFHSTVALDTFYTSQLWKCSKLKLRYYKHNIEHALCLSAPMQEMPFRSSVTSARRWSTMTAPRQSTSSTALSTCRTCVRRRCWSSLMVSFLSAYLKCAALSVLGFFTGVRINHHCPC